MIKSFIFAAFLAASLSFAQVSSIPSASGSGASTFDNVGSGTNTTATLTCGSGCTLITTAGIFRLPNGTSAPGTCTVGDAFFDTDATAGLNFYGCTATNTWTLLGDGGSGSTAFTDIADFKVTKTSDTVLTVAAGKYRYLASDGTYTVASLSSATLTVASGAETADPAVRFSIDENSGSPIIRCIVATSLTSGNYTASGCTKTSADVFPTGNYQLATVSISSAVWGTPTDLRTLAGVSNYSGSASITKTGNVFSLNTANATAWGAAHSSDSTYNYCAPSGASGTTYACSISPAITALATGAHYFFKADVANTGAATINFNSLGAKTIKKYAGGVADLAANDIRADQIVEVIYDGTNMQMVNQLGNASSSGSVTCDPFSATQWCLVETFPNTSATANQIGTHGWMPFTIGSGGYSFFSSSRYAPGSVLLTTSTATGDTNTLTIHTSNETNNGSGLFTSVFQNQAHTIEFWFKTGSSVTNHSFHMGHDVESSVPFANRTGPSLRFVSGTDTNWSLRNNYSTESCVGSEAPAADTFYVLRQTGTGTSTLTFKLYKSTTSYQAAIAGASDLLGGSCTLTVSASTYGFSPFIAVRTATTAAASLLFSRYFAKVEY